MKKIIFNAAGLLLVCSLTTQAAEKRENIYYVGADVDAQGHVTATQMDAGIPAPLTTALAGAVRQWQFLPAKRDGQAVVAHTFIRARLEATPDTAGNYHLRISYAGNGPRLFNSPQPHFPKEAFHGRESAFTFLEATAQPDGRLTDMVVSSQFEAWPIRVWFKNSLLNAAKQWHTEPEMVDGKPVVTHIRIPVNFMLSGSDFTREQIEILRKAAHRDATTPQSGIPLPSEQAIALDSPLQLKTVASAP